MTTATQTRRGFAVNCPKCGEDSIMLEVNDLTAIKCSSCVDVITPDEIHALIAQWQRLLAWVETAPEYQD